jgi:ubiquitin-protein ligase
LYNEINGACRLRKQITSLFTYNDHIKELTPEKQYELPFSSGSLDIALLINLPAEFPQDPPVITITPTDLRHPWIESNVVTWPEKLHVKSWTTQSNLGKIIQEIREEFTRVPPVKSTQSDVVDDDWIAVTSPVSYVYWILFSRQM